jgi:hypothetical protein
LEIELPDGTVLEAPEGANVKQVVQGYRRKLLKQTNPAEYDSTSQAWKDKYGPVGKARGTYMQPVRGAGEVELPLDDGFTEGMGSGMERMTRGLGNIANKAAEFHPLTKALGLKLAPADIASDEAIREQDSVDQPLADTTRGKIGQVVGQTAVASAATAPLGGVGGLARGGTMLARTLTGPTARAGVEGAITGAGAADPDEQGMGAAKGAVLGATISKILGLGGRAVRGLINKSEEAKNLEQIAGQHGEEIFAPISQVASTEDLTSRLAKTLYAEGLSFIPGVKGQLTRQAEDARGLVRELALREATPTGVTLPKGSGNKVGEAVGTLKRSFDDAYQDTVKSYAFNVPEDFKDSVAAALKKEIPNIDDTTLAKVSALAHEQMTRFSSGKGTIDGANLLNVKNEIGRLIGQAPRVEKPAMRIAQEQVEDIITQELSQGGSRQNLADLAKYGDLTEPYRHFVGLNKAARAARANRGNFSMNQLANKASDPGQLDLAQQAGAVLNTPAAGTSFTGRGLLGGAGLIGTGAAAGVPAAAGLLIGGNLLATKTVQKALLGDLAAQRMISEFLQKNPQAVEKVAQQMRVVAAQQAGESDE